jgi:hypothetical protein
MKHISTKQMFGRYGGTFGMASFYPSRGMPNRNVGRQGFEKINIRNCDCTKGFAHGTRGPSRRIPRGDNAYTLQSASPGFDRGIFAAAGRRDRRFRTIRPESQYRKAEREMPRFCSTARVGTMGDFIWLTG